MNQIKQTPVIGQPRTLCTMPDLKELNGKNQQIVDHGIIQAQNGKWQLWACLRGVKVGRLIYGWEGDSLEVENWRHAGVKLRADAEARELIKPDGEEMIGAPFFIQNEDRYFCYYHSAGIRVAVSDDGVSYERMTPNLTSIPSGRDVMVMKHNELFYAYVTTSTLEGESYVESSTSKNRIDWSEPVIVSKGGQGGSGIVDAESPFVVFVAGYFYLFRTSSMTFKTVVYRSEDPQAFGIDDDSKLVAELDVKILELFLHENQWYTTHISDDFQSVLLSKIEWETVAK